MKTIKQDELFQSLSDFLKVKGVEFGEGAYAERIRRACNLLGDTINATQRTARKAKLEVDKNLSRLRHTFHETMARKPASGSTPEAGTATPPKIRPARKPRKRSAKSTRPSAETG